MFFHNINPVLVQIGPLAIRYYSLVYVLGFLLAYFLLINFVKQKKITNLSRERVDSYILWLIVGVILGARIFEVLAWQPGYYFANPIEIPQIWHGGMSFHGGLVGAFVVSFFFCRKYRIDVYELGDLLVIPAAITLGFGRIANFINAELLGKPTSILWLCIDYSKNQFIAGLSEGCRHPSQMYEAIKNFFIFGVLMFMRSMKLPKGFLFWMFVTLYGFLRFTVNFWRDDPVFIFGLSTGQVMSLIMGIIGTIMLVKLWNSFKRKEKGNNTDGKDSKPDTAGY